MSMASQTDDTSKTFSHVIDDEISCYKNMFMYVLMRVKR